MTLRISHSLKSVAFIIGLVGILWAAVLPVETRADSLKIVYDVSQNQTAVAQMGAFTVVTFTGSVANISGAPVLFQLTGGPEPFEPYVAAFQVGIPFPGITLAPGASTGTIDLATVTLQQFDRDLVYPGFVKIALEAIAPGTGNTLTENDASIKVVTASSMPEPSIMLMAILGLIGVVELRPRKLSKAPHNLVSE